MLIPIELRAEAEFIAALPARQQFAGLIEFLSTTHSRRNRLAMILLSALPAEAVTPLLQEAVTPGRTPQHRIRILEVVERIGRPLDYDQWTILATSAPLYGKAVQEKMAGLRLRLYPGERALQAMGRALASRAVAAQSASAAAPDGDAG